MPQMRIDALSYRNRAMNLQLVAPDLTTIDAFSRELEETRRFEVVLEANNPVDEGTEGRLRIAGANQQVDDETRAGLPLTVQVVRAVGE